jgi:hypothetical protein
MLRISPCGGITLVESLLPVILATADEIKPPRPPSVVVVAVPVPEPPAAVEAVVPVPAETLIVTPAAPVGTGWPSYKQIVSVVDRSKIFVECLTLTAERVAATLVAPLAH